ncbi:bifunctional lysylphosphatidylglycerol flippase/synthetase MprF [Sinorhizobium sp. BG8]|uniref:bifunctional lysylphosphatidylglycerol flippase/synthetase MprF n=1 Tax=Sinorhizobium sp. BG8 TaxID=2613773 RepID=UPI001AFC0375|nr:bifunctional lysylphosphatidylglycerol flippase/synthetase MprF [Sinorhizobium sp. BG8]QRM54825.1 bifunctional lysylphosphatidylglycerol flippase/synthetase MprF [Sinorhizobium sp. BG8]
MALVKRMQSELASPETPRANDQPKLFPWSGHRLSAVLLPIAGVVIALLALYVLEQHVHAISFREIRDDLYALSASRLALAILFTVVSFSAVAFYDVVAVETIAPGRVSKRVSAMAGAAGYAISNALGFSLLTGGALRYRVYAAQGIELADIGRIVGTSWFAIWFAFAIMAAIAMVAEPDQIPWLATLGPAVDVSIGIAVLAAIAALVLWLSRGARTVGVGSFSLRLPTSRGALMQIAAGLVDMTAAAACLYVLLPSGSVGSFSAFILVYVVAVILGIASHAPGGVGAFEATIIAGLGLGSNSEALAGLVAYRIVYTLLPFLVAVAGLVVSEILRHRSRIAGPVGAASLFLEPLIPPLSAGIAFFGAAVLLISAVTPSLEGRIEALSEVIPLPFLEMSHLGASFVAVGLLIVARGLAKRLRRAWFAAIILFASGAVFSFFKGLDWEEAVALSMMALTLLVFRDSFYRRPFNGDMHLSWGWLASMGTMVFAAIWLGLFAFRHVEYDNELWWQFAWEGDAPRFLRGAVFIVTLLAAVLVDTLINRRVLTLAPEGRMPESVPAVVADAPSSSAALALLGDKRFLVSPDQHGFVMYQRSGGSLISMGEPVAADESMSGLAWAFHELADKSGLRTVFYEVGPEHLPMFLDMGLVALKLGEVARVDLTTFSLDGPKRQPLRYADRRADKDGLTFEIIPKEKVPEIIPQLSEVSDEWLEMKSGGEKRFSLGYFDPGYMSLFDVAVLKRGERIVAFANLWRGGGHHEMAVDLMRYRQDDCKVMMDALFTKLMLIAKAEGYHWFNLGAAPLSGLTDRRTASRWNRLGSLIYQKGRDLYHFDGLRAFKDKFGPVWTANYLICPPGLDTARALLDVTTLISGRPLVGKRK